MRKVKIGYVVSSLGYGGVEKYVIDIANRLDRQKFIPVIFTFKKGGPLKQHLESDITVHEFNKRKGNDPVFPFHLAGLLKKEAVDVLHSNNWSTFVESVIARKIAAIPVLLHAQHGIEKNEAKQESPRKRFFRNRLRFISSLMCDCVVVVSQATRDFVCKEWGTSTQKVTLIYNGVDVDSFLQRDIEGEQLRSSLQISKDDIVIGSVGRLMPVKNYPCLVKAFSKISSSQDNVRLMLIGDGNQYGELRRLANSMGLDDKVIFLGQRSDVKKLLSVLDIFVLPSFSEGVSLALLEAMAAEIPVVATNVGGNPEVVIPGENGLLVPSNNETELANALMSLVDNKEKRSELALAAHDRVANHFCLKRMVEEYENLYLSLMDKRKC